MTSVAVIVKTRTQPGKRDEAFALYEELLAPRAAQNTDQPVVVWVADSNDADVFFLFEVYSDPAAMGANAEADWFGEYMQRAMPMLAGEPEFSMGEPRWSKGISPGPR
jgi:quinol monooxygenase YgiN